MKRRIERSPTSEPWSLVLKPSDTTLCSSVAEAKELLLQLDYFIALEERGAKEEKHD